MTTSGRSTTAISRAATRWDFASMARSTSTRSRARLARSARATPTAPGPRRAAASPRRGGALSAGGLRGGWVGSVVGKKTPRQFERALTHRRPAVMFCASGGARMQEGVLSLMQMAKTSAARRRLREAKVPYISVLLHPTTGGVAASVAMLGDLIIAEPDALIGFARPRVLAQAHW